MTNRTTARAARPRTGVSRRTFLKAGVASLAALAGLGLLPRRAIAATADVDAIVAGMTRRQKIEQMLMPDFRQWQAAGAAAPTDMTELSSEVADIIDTYNFGGVILFANNVKETEQTLKLTMDMQAAALANASGEAFGDIPLLLTIDQEGGIVYRLGSGTALPGNMALGATRSVEDARNVGEVIGRELNALKLNVNFAPVLDVNNNPNNPVIGLRSISSDPALVSELGIPMIEGMQEHNVATAAKHFPGHGDAGTDSHTGLPRIEKTREELEQIEFVPFKAAIAAGVDMVMTAHIQYPKVETETAVSAKDGSTIELPATLSKVFMTDILRTEMGFTGVAVTDALNMQAIADNFGYIDAVKRTFAAGVDIALMPVTLRSVADVAKLDALIEAVEADAALTDARLDESVRRILELKATRGILTYADGAGTFEANLATAKEQVGSAENRTIERDVAADAVTVVRNEGGVLPMRPVAGDHVLLVAGWENEQPGMELSMRRLIAEGVIPEGVTYESLNYAESYTDADAAVAAITEKIANASQVVVISEVGSASNLDPDKKTLYGTYVPTRVVRAAKAAGVPAAVLSISKPYDVGVYTETDAVAAAYGNKGMDPTEGLAPSAAFGPNVPAGVEVIFGGHEAAGKLPVDVYAIKVVDGVSQIDTSAIVYPFGTGLTYPKVTDAPAVDKSALEAAVADADANVVPRQNVYSPESYATFAAALAQARTVLERADATQDEVDAAVKALADAKDGLIGKGSGTPDPVADTEPGRDGRKKGSGKQTPGKLPKTGDAAGVMAAAAAVAGAVAVGYGVKAGAGSEE